MPFGRLRCLTARGETGAEDSKHERERSVHHDFAIIISK
jgi:hypothetical protein